MSLDLETGYVIDAEYTRNVYPDMFPRHLAYICATLGFETRAAKLSEGFDYCELGCGTGMTSNVMAASNPEGRFYAVDLNPAHIATGTRVAAAGGLTNLTFIESTFADLLSRNLPDFDFIALHGVYSWIGPEHRRQVVEFIRQKLRPGGIVYMSYNALPGWAATMPLRKLMVEHTASMQVNSLQKASAALKFLKSFSAQGGNYFTDNPKLVSFIEELTKHPLNYIVHEYLNADWHPQYFADVQKEMAHARVAYAGEGDIRMNYPELMLNKAVREVIDQAPNVTAYQTQRDFMSNTKFRRDLFVKGGSTIAAHKRDRLFADLYFGAYKTEKMADKFKFPAVEMSPAPLAHALFEQAQKSPLSLAQVYEIAAAQKAAPKDALAAIQLLMAAEHLQVMRTGSYGPPLKQETAKNAHLAVPAFNAAVLEEAVVDTGPAYLAAVHSGTVLMLPALDSLLLSGWLKVGLAEAAEWCWSQIEKRGMNITDAGKSLTGRAQHLPMFQLKLEQFSKTAIPILCKSGVIQTLSSD